MKRFILSFLALFLLFSVSASAVIPDTLRDLMTADGEKNAQEWLDGALTGGAGQDADWCVIALLRSGEVLDPSSYVRAATAALRETENPLTRQRIALALLCAGEGKEEAARIASETFGKSGIMSEIYALLLQNAVSPEEAAENAAILALHALPGGGFALSGTKAMPDVTAMALCALAPHHGEETVAEVIDASLDVLSRMQNPDGTFTAYGQKNPESSAQVLIALCTLGISSADPRFVKEKTIPEGIALFRTEGGYSHTLGGSVNRMATVQVSLAQIAQRRAETGREGLYALSFTAETAESGESKEPQTESGTVSVTDPTTETGKAEEEKKQPVRPILLVVTWCAAVGIALLLILRKKQTKLRLTSLFLAALLLSFLILKLDFQSENDFYTSQTDPAEIAGYVTLCVECRSLIGEKGIPSDGILLPPLTLPISSGETASGVLLSAAARERFQIGTEGKGAMVYVSSLFDLAEGQFGPQSGWIFEVNGKPPAVGCGELMAKDGDQIVFRFVREIGESLFGS